MSETSFKDLVRAFNFYRWTKNIDSAVKPTICNKQHCAPFALRLIINFTVMFRRSAFYQFTIKHERFSRIYSHSPVNDVDRSREIPFSKIQTHFWLTIWRISFNTGFYPLIIVLKFNLFSLFFPIWINIIEWNIST